MSLGSFTLLISRECDTYYKTRSQKLIHRVDALRFPHSVRFLKSGGAEAPMRSELHSRRTQRPWHGQSRRISGGKAGGANRDRTDDLLLAKQALSQLSYGPIKKLVGLGRVELPTSPLSGVRSNQLSYRPGVRLGRLMQVI
jgi:hypothetical protein